jgi:ATP-dependent RNA helicase DDX55/SPB4
MSGLPQGSRAFVSFVRGYKEHQCRFIFRFKELSLGRLAAAFALLRLPRMPETKRCDPAPHFAPSAVLPDDVPYKDRAREKQRLARRAEDATAADAAAAERSQQPPQPRADARCAPEPEPVVKPTALKRRMVRACIPLLLGSLVDRADLRSAALRRPAPRLQEQQRADDDDMDTEWKLLKKLKKGQISEHEYNVAVGLSDSDDSADAGGEAPRGGAGSTRGPGSGGGGGRKASRGRGGASGGAGQLSHARPQPQQPPREREERDRDERKSKPRHARFGGRGAGRGGGRSGRGKMRR